MSGWIKLHRKLLDNPIVCKDADHLAIWTYLLLNATHKEKQAIFQGLKITLQPGQLITGRKAIAEALRVTESKVQRVLSCFESEQQIEQQTSNKNRLITILRWAEYQHDEQQNEQQMNNKRTTNEQQVNTNKNERNKEIYNNPPISPQKGKTEKVQYAEYVSLTTAEYQKLVDQYGEELTKEMITVLDNYKGSNGKRYKSDYRAILNWVVDRVMEKRKTHRTAPRLQLVQISKEEEEFLEQVYRERAEAARSARGAIRSVPF